MFEELLISGSEPEYMRVGNVTLVDIGYLVQALQTSVTLAQLKQSEYLGTWRIHVLITFAGMMNWLQMKNNYA